MNIECRKLGLEEVMLFGFMVMIFGNRLFRIYDVVRWDGGCFWGRSDWKRYKVDL